MMDPSGVEDSSVNVEEVVEAQAMATGDDSPKTKENVNLGHELSVLTPAQSKELQRIDVDGDGVISRKEARAAARSSAELRAMLSWWKKLVLVIVLLLFLQSGIMGGLVVGIVAAYKDTYTKDSGTLSDGDGHVVKTAPAIIGLPRSSWPPCSTAPGSPRSTR